MCAWYPGRVLPLQEEDEEGSMRVAYDDGAELPHPLTERWRAEGASDNEEGAEAEQGPADTEAESMLLPPGAQLHSSRAAPTSLTPLLPSSGVSC